MAHVIIKYEDLSSSQRNIIKMISWNRVLDNFKTCKNGFIYSYTHSLFPQYTVYRMPLFSFSFLLQLSCLRFKSRKLPCYFVTDRARRHEAPRAETENLITAQEAVPASGAACWYRPLAPKFSGVNSEEWVGVHTAEKHWAWRNDHCITSSKSVPKGNVTSPLKAFHWHTPLRNSLGYNGGVCTINIFSSPCMREERTVCVRTGIYVASFPLSLLLCSWRCSVLLVSPLALLQNTGTCAGQFTASRMRRKKMWCEYVGHVQPMAVVQILFSR